MAIDSTGRTPVVAETASATSLTGTLPTGRLTGDYVVAVAGLSCTTAQLTAPSGWTELVAPVATNASNRILAAYGRFDPPAGPAFGTSAAAGRHTVICQAYGGVDTSIPLDVAASLAVVSSQPVTIPSVTTVTDGARLISGIVVDSASLTYTQPSGMTLLGASAVGTGRGCAMADQVATTAGATGTRAWAASAGSLSMRGALFALRPQVDTPAPTPTLSIAWVGAPTAAGFTVATKTVDATDVRIKVGTDSGVTTGVTWTSLLTPDSASWTQSAVAALAADTDYWYAVEMTDGDDGTHLSTIYGPVATLPTVGTAADVRIAVGSCLSSEDGTVATAFTNLLARAPDLFFHLGDFHYANSSSTAAATHRGHLEAKITGNSGLAAVLANVATVYIKSDHDAGGGNGALPGSYSAPNLAAHLQVVPHLPQVVATALYHSFVVGRVKIIMTDDRYARTITKYLDDAQLAWLRAELITDEPVKLWMQQGPWLISDTPGDPSTGADKWCDYPDQHEELGDWIAASAVGQVLTVHGDSHALMGDDGSNNSFGGFPVWCSSPFANSRVVRGGPYSQGTWPNTAAGVDTTVGYQYSIIDITDDGEIIELAFSGRDSGDVERVAMTVTVDTSEPEAPATPAARSGWGELLAIVREPVEQPPEDFCPNDGMPYRDGPNGQRYCPFDGYRPGTQEGWQ